MAKTNGFLTSKSVVECFSKMTFDEQVSLLVHLQDIHGKIRHGKITALKRELAALEKGSPNGHATGKRGPKPGTTKVKYRDPKSGNTWSGRGRMALWLANKVKAGEKAAKYLA